MGYPNTNSVTAPSCGMSFNADNLITAIATVASGGLSGLFAWLAARNSIRATTLREEHQRLRRAHVKALEQIEAYHVLEGIFAAELELLGSSKALTVKTEFRNRVESAGFVRPSTTANEARRGIEELQGQR